MLFDLSIFVQKLQTAITCDAMAYVHDQVAFAQFQKTIDDL